MDSQLVHGTKLLQPVSTNQVIAQRLVIVHMDLFFFHYGIEHILLNLR